MPLTDFTSPDEVRAALGVSARELKDAALDSQIYLTELTEQLRELHPELIDSYTAAKAADPATADQKRFVELTQVYSTYVVAKHALGKIEMFAPRVIKDARAEMERAENPFDQLREDVKSMLGRLRTRLVAAHAVVNPDGAPVVPPAVGVIGINVPLAVDPVLG